MRPKAQKPIRKGMLYRQYHSLPSLAHTVHILHEGLELLLPRFWGCCVV